MPLVAQVSQGLVQLWDTLLDPGWELRGAEAVVAADLLQVQALGTRTTG